MFAVRYLIIFVLLASSCAIKAAPVQGFLPKQVSFNEQTPQPKATLGFEIGQRHVRHDQLKQYFNVLAQQSNRVKITSIGKTAQLREQFLVTVSNLENLANLDNILQSRTFP